MYVCVCLHHLSLSIPHFYSPSSPPTPCLTLISPSHLTPHSHQHRGALRLDDPREAGLVLLAGDERVHQEAEADPRDEEVVQDAVDAMPLDKANLAPSGGG